MNLGQSIRAGVTWLLLGSTGGQILQFAFGIVMARLLVPADFGMVVTVQVFTGFVGLLASGGMGQSLIRAKEASTDEFNTVFTLQLALGILIYAGFFFSAPWLGEYLHNALYADLLRVSALNFLLRPFAMMRGSWLSREMQFKKRALVTLAGGALTGVTSVSMAAAGLGVWSLILSGLIGSLFSNLLFSLVTPLRLRLHLDRFALRRHSRYGVKITTNEFLDYVKEQSVNLILSKMAGPAFVGLFNKAEGLARWPNRLITPPTGQTVFRAMSRMQDDLDQTKYMFYRTVTLLMVYICPTLVGLWWVAEPFIAVVYGPKWVAAAEPMKILILAMFLRPIRTPCGVVLDAQNRLTQEMVALTLSVGLTIAACLIGLRWGLVGVAWAYLADGLFVTVYYYVLVYKTIPTRVAELLAAVAPGVLLSVLIAVVLGAIHFFLSDLKPTMPALYLVIMGIVGFVVYVVSFLFLPVPALRSEAARWRRAIRSGVSVACRAFT
jgi:teichuronic acid exporter